MMNTVCFDVEEPLLELVFQQDNPAMPRVDIDILKAGARKSKKESVLQVDFQATRAELRAPCRYDSG